MYAIESFYSIPKALRNVIFYSIHDSYKIHSIHECYRKFYSVQRMLYKAVFYNIFETLS